MENLHLKNLNRKDIIDDCIKLKEAADENNDEKIEYCINNIQKHLFPITLNFSRPPIHIHPTINHIRDIEQAMLIDIDHIYTKTYAKKKLKEEVIKYINNLKNYEKRILPQIKEKLKELEKITNQKEKEDMLQLVKNLMFLNFSKF